MICNVCNSSQSEPLFQAQDYEHGVPGSWKVVRCSACGLVAQDPLPAPTEIASFYPASYSAYNSDTIIGWMSEAVFAQDARRISRLVPKEACILDVGCGNGRALLAMRRLGFTGLRGLRSMPRLRNTPNNLAWTCVAGS